MAEKPTPEQSRWKIPFALCVAVLGVSSSAPLVKLADAPAPAVAAYRMLLSALLLLPVVAWRHRAELATMRRSDLLRCIAAGVLLGFHFLSWFTSLDYTTVASAVTLTTLQPLFAFVLAYAMFGECLRLKAFAGAALSIAGAMIIGWGDIAVSGMALFGDALALLGAALATGYFFVGFRARQHLSLNAYTFLIYTAAAGVLFAYCATLGVPLAGYADSDWAVFLGLAIFPTLLGHSVFNWSMRWVSATVISMVVLCEPIGASALAWLIFGTLPQLSHYIGGAAVLVGVLIFMRYRNPPPAASGAG